MTESSDSKRQSLVRKIPQVDRVLRHDTLVAEQGSFRRDLLAEITRQELERYRRNEGMGEREGKASFDAVDQVARSVVARARSLASGSLIRVINGTGVILNTNLGRSPLPECAVKRAADILTGYANLEIDLKSGKRGERGCGLDELLGVLTGCEAALLVNNNAAAVMLTVTALAHGKEVIVSRGELIEIGGSFRLPDVVEAAGGILKEVGSTNRTRLADFEKALSDKTGIILSCHRSNFEIVGFTETAPLEELVDLAKKAGVPLVVDLGSGALADLSRLGLKHEPTVKEIVATGADLVMFSADKLLGGSQAGIIVGKHELVGKLRKNPIYRALRADKLAIAVAEQVLTCYLRPEPEKEVPALHLASLPVETLMKRAHDLINGVSKDLRAIELRVVDTTSTYGGGTLPGQALKSAGVAVVAKTGGQGGRRISAYKIADLLRAGSPPVVSVIKDEQVVMDLRTVLGQEDSLLAQRLQEVDMKITSQAPPPSA